MVTNEDEQCEGRAEKTERDEMPDMFYDTEANIPDGWKEFATKTEDGKFKIPVAPAAKLTSFRDNNIALLQERDTLKEQVGKLNAVVGDDIDGFTAHLAELRDTHQKVKDGTLKGTGAVQAEVESRIKSVREGFEGQLLDAGNKLKEANSRSEKFESLFKEQVRNQAITNAVIAQESGANAQALPDFLSRAARVFTVDDAGKLIPKNGETVIYGSDGATPMTPNEWLAKELESAPYLRKPSAGGGATGGNGSSEKYGGMSEEEFLKLPPTRRMEMARAAAGKGNR